MRRPAPFVSAAVAALLAVSLAGCGQSVEDSRAEAYTTVSSLKHLNKSQQDSFRARLDSAADTAAIDQIVAEARSTDAKEATQDAAETAAAAKASASAEASASASASAAAEASASAEEASASAAAELVAIQEALSGHTFVGTSSNRSACVGTTLVFNADGTISGTALGPLGSSACLPTSETTWKVTQENVRSSTGFAVTNSEGSLYITSSISLNDDGSITISALYGEEATFSPQ